MSEKKKKKKADYEALNSSFMRIPKMDTITARCLIDLGYQETFQLNGLSADSLFEDAKKKFPELTQASLYRLRMAVYYAETPDPSPRMLDPTCWVD